MTPMNNVRIFLVDDHRLFRDALRSLLGTIPNFQIVGETGDAFEVDKLVRQTQPHIVCMDIGLPSMNGIETTRRLIEAIPSVKVIALSTYSDQRYIMDMIHAGASAYVTKAEASEELLRAISAVQQNRKYFCSDIAGAVTSVMTRLSQADMPGKLGNRERQVLQLVAEGLTSAMIAEKLNIASSTVDVHRRNIMRKLHLRNVADLTRYAINNEIVSR